MFHSFDTNNYQDWRCKICDFGLSRLQQGDLKTMGRLCGTFHFAGPEVFQGGVATDKFDVYSMGIVLWELLNTVATYVFVSKIEKERKLIMK